MKGFRARLDYILKHYYLINRCFNYVGSFFMRLLGIFVRMDSKMVIFSGHSRKYNDSPKAIYEYLLACTEKFKGYKFVWALEDLSTEIPGNPILVKVDTIKYFLYTLKAKYWVTCVNIERGLNYKKRDCRYLNTWHGVPFKHIGNDATDRKDYDFSSVDFFCYSSDYEKKIYMRAFNLREEAMIPTGLPRNDDLYEVSQIEINAIKNKLRIPLDKKVILYAPTWRDSIDGGNSYVMKPPISVEKWCEELGDDYIVLFRTHAYTNRVMGINFNDVIRDYSSYPDVNVLFKISDILISDYSAAMADYAILERPILCFAYDYEDYKKNRGLYINGETDMPSGVLATEEQLLQYIKTMDYVEECKKTKHVMTDRLVVYGRNATKLCVNKLFGV